MFLLVSTTMTMKDGISSIYCTHQDETGEKLKRQLGGIQCSDYVFHPDAQLDFLRTSGCWKPGRLNVCFVLHVAPVTSGNHHLSVPFYGRQKTAQETVKCHQFSFCLD